ncbi:threonine--tRNA ligase [Candidatus Micrarchaeota archaeon]|nr:threonine--tRNA ligase [Candidatus Micrarchaeota archaeon]
MAVLVNGKRVELPEHSRGFDLRSALNDKEAVAVKINGKLCDLSTELPRECEAVLVHPKSPEGTELLSHSSSHVLASAVKELFPNTKFGIGPAVEEGFYYDFLIEKPFSPEDVDKIEKKAREIIARDEKFVRTEVSKEEAKKIFAHEPFKLDLLAGITNEKVSIYQNGSFIDLCVGPHVPSTGAIKAFKLTKTGAAYWKGDQRNAQLQRIYGISFSSKEEMDACFKLMEEAEKRDHRKLGTALDLFSVHKEAPGSPFFHPAGMVIWNELERFWEEEHSKAGYLQVKTPLILHENLWRNSGHWDHYRNSMYFTKIDEENYALKPMNCPGCILIYSSSLHSYKEFPLRLAEMGMVHRHELSGVLSGLFRVRMFTQDDAHIFMTEEQLVDEVTRIIELTDRMYKVFKFDYEVELSTKPEKAMGDPLLWEKAEKALADAMKRIGKSFKINPGEGAFYGPKLDFKIRDSLGRMWQCATIQVDFQMPERFDLHYEGPDGRMHRPVMIHRVVFGSFERFIGILVEHYAGAFPTWLSPTQVSLLPISAKQNDYAVKVKEALEKEGIRVLADLRDEKLEAKVRDFQLKKIPYALVIGSREAESNTVSVRKRGGQINHGVPLEKFIEEIKAEIRERHSQ